MGAILLNLLRLSRALVPFLPFIFLFFRWLFWRIGDWLKIPKSTYVPAKVIVLNNPGGRGIQRQTWRYFQLTFEFPNQETVTFLVNRRIYDSLSTGSTGVLEYVPSMEHLRKFHVNKTLAEVVNPDKNQGRAWEQGFTKKEIKSKQRQKRSGKR